MEAAKRKKPRLFVCGDIHGRWNVLNRETDKIVNSQYPEDKIVLISVGDFGYWPGIEQYSLDKINIYDGRLSIYFCPGNHENWWALKELEQDNDDIIKVSKNIFYCSFGATKRFNGRTFLFCGGADSIDKQVRTLGVDWFPEEVISERDMSYLPDKKVQVVISHTSPNSVNYLLSRYLPNRMVFNSDPSAKYLNFVYDKYIPKQWFFGHWHVHCQFRDQDTDFTCLDKIDGNRASITEIYF